MWLLVSGSHLTKWLIKELGPARHTGGQRWAKVLAAELDNMISILIIHMVERKKQLPQIVL